MIHIRVVTVQMEIVGFWINLEDRANIISKRLTMRSEGKKKNEK